MPAHVKMLKQIDGRTIVDLAVMYAGFAVRLGAPIALIPLLGRVLGPDNYGLLTVAGAVTLWAWQITESGLPTVASRELAVAKSTEDAVAVASASVAARFVMAVPAFLVSLAMIAGMPELRAQPVLAALSVLLGFQSAFNFGWLFMAQGKRRLLAAAETIPPVLTLVLCFLFVTERDHAVRALAIMNVSALLTNLVFWWVAGRSLPWRLPRFAEVKHELSTSANFLVLRITGLVSQTVSVYLLGLMTTTTDVAHFAVADKVVTACIAMFGPIYQMIFPLTMKFGVGEQGAARSLAWVSAGILGLSVLGTAILWVSSYRLLILVMGPQYQDASEFIRWFACTIPVAVASQLFVTCVMVPLRRDRALVSFTVSLTIFGTALTTAAIWMYGPQGIIAARLIGTVVSAGAMAVVGRSVLLDHLRSTVRPLVDRPVAAGRA